MPITHYLEEKHTYPDQEPLLGDDFNMPYFVVGDDALVNYKAV
jgi:hypothetical protein